MKARFTAVTWCCLLLSAATASALDCGRAVSPIEKTICSQADLAHLDADMNDMYTRLRPQLTPKARGELLMQQRAWLAERDRLCATGDADCLRREYGLRMDQLAALDAAAGATDGQLKDLNLLVVKGAWKAIDIHDPAGTSQTTHPDTRDVRESLKRADLPPVGSLVNAGPGKVCFLANACDPMAWTRTALAQVDGAEAISRVLGLSQSAQVLVGNSGAKQSPLLLLVPRSNGSFWAIFILCVASAHDCHYAAEVWTSTAQTPYVGPLMSR